jgi:hypothetical protein
MVLLRLLSLHCSRKLADRNGCKRIHIGDFNGMFVDIFWHSNRETGSVSLGDYLSEEDNQRGFEEDLP